MNRLWLLLLGLLSALLINSARAADNEPPATVSADVQAATAEPARATTWSARAPEPRFLTLAQLPPWPGPMPTQFVDVYAYEATLRARLHDITLREAGLTELGRPPSRARWLLAGWLTAGAGLTVGLVSYAFAMETVNELPFRTLVVTGLVGGVACVTGLVMLWSAPKNPYRHEIRALHREGELLKSELSRLRWERFVPQLGVSLRGVALSARF